MLLKYTDMDKKQAPITREPVFLGSYSITATQLRL